MSDENILLGHADDNDGIDEYDNRLPMWWQGLFAITVVWGVGYAIDYHFVSERSQAGSYDAEMLAAAEKWPQQQAQPVAASAVTPEAIAAGKEVYVANCVACHGQQLEGGIGPNLADDEWIHGGELDQIVKTVTEGVPAKGMITWGPILGPEKITQVSAFIYDASHK